MDENKTGILPEDVTEEEYAGKEEYVEEVSTPGLIFEDTDGYYTVTGYRGEDTEVVIPSSFEGHPVTSIGDEAFLGCTHLTGITIPNSITGIGDCAFGGCTSLVSIAIPSSVKYIRRRTFDGCTGLTSVTIGDGVKHIGTHSFEGCTSLRDITIPDSVVNISLEAFSGCTSLRDIYIPRGVTRIDGHAFKDCTNLTISCEAKRQPARWSKYWNRKGGQVIWGVAREKGGGLNQRTKITVVSLLAVVILGIIIALVSISNSKFVMTDMGSYYEVSGYKGVWTEIVIPSRYNGRPVSSIGDNAFSGHSGLTKVTIPGSVTSIGKNAFSGCTSLTIHCESSGQYVALGEGWNCGCPVVWGHTCLDQNADRKCDNCEISIKNKPVATPPVDITEANPATDFEYTTESDGIVTITKYIGTDTTVVIPSDIEGKPVTSIGSSAFNHCYSLTSITIPDSVTTIGDSAFKYCYSLTSITIGDGVTSIGSSAFGDCTNLSIYCEATEQPDGWDAKWNPSNCPVVWGHEGA